MENKPSDFLVKRSFWLSLHNTRIELTVELGVKWEIKATPANSPKNEDEILDLPIDFARIEEQYGLNKVGAGAYVMTAFLMMTAPLVKFFNKPNAWRRWGIYDKDGKAIELGRERD